MTKLYFIVCTAILLVSCEAILFEEDISDSSVIVLAPLHNSVVETNNVNFNWTAVEDADNYQLQIAIPDFVNATQILTDSILPETSFNLNLEPSDYQWRVRALNENSETIYTTVSFKVQPETFDEDISEEVIELIAPSIGAILETNPITFTWEEVEFAESYVLQIATPGFENATQVVFDEIVYGTTTEQSLINGAYQWRVKAKNSEFETEYVTSSIIVELLPIEEDISEEIVILTAPSDGSLLETNPITFSWEEVEFAESYVLQIATPDFDNPTQITVDETLATTSYQHIIVDGEYQWRVKAVNTASETSYSTSSFTVAIDGSNNISDEIVTLIAPSDNAELNMNTISFTWDAIPYTENYVLQIATPDFDNPTQVVIDETLSGTSSEQTLNDGQYQWRVKAVNSSSETSYSTSSFTVLVNGGNDISNETVSLIAPSDGTELNMSTISFNWNAVPFAEDYVLQVATPNFINPTQVFVDEILTESSSTQTLNDGQFQWRVKARNSSSETDYTTSSFSVATGIGFPDREVFIISPSNNFISNQSPLNIQWQAVEDATLYRIQIYDANTNVLLNEETTSQTNIPFNFPEGNLIWQVRAETASQSTGYTSQNITIDSVAPNTPVLLSPADEEILTSTSVNFTWSREAIAGTTESDRIYIYEDETLSILVLEEEVSGGNFNTTLINNETYYWLMNAYDEAGNQSVDSAVFHFTIIE